VCTGSIISIQEPYDKKSSLLLTKEGNIASLWQREVRRDFSIYVVAIMKRLIGACFTTFMIRCLHFAVNVITLIQEV